MSEPSSSERPEDYAAIAPRDRARQRTRRALATLAGGGGAGSRPLRVRGPKPRIRIAEWILVPAAAATAIVLILYGSDDFGWKGWFRGIDAFTSGFPSGDELDGSAAVAWGRALATVVALYATIRLVMVLYAQRIRDWRVRRLRNHTIVAGLGETGLRAVHQERTSGRTVVTITDQPFSPAAEEALRVRAYVVAGAGADPATLHAAGVHGSARIVCAEANDVVNVQLALDAVEARSDAAAAPFELLVEASESSAATELLEVVGGVGVVRVFSLRELWAWRLLSAGPLWRYRELEEPPPDIVVVGGSGIVYEFVTCACRWWHFDALERKAADRLRVVVIDPNAEQICGEVVRRHPELHETVDLRPAVADLAECFDAVDGAVHGDARRWAVYVCLDASDAIRRSGASAVARRLAGREEGTIFVAISSRAHRQANATPAIVELEAAGDEHGFDPAHFGRTERLARAIHGVYERHMRAAGVVAAPALAAFDDLLPELRDSNRQQARGVDTQLLAILKATAPLRNWSQVHELTSEEVELLSELEHLRWCIEKTAAGWTYGAVRDDGARLHPDLVPSATLPDEQREINRAFMRQRPWTLARVGEAIVAHPARQRLARLTHETYRTEVQPSALAWPALPDSERAASHAFVDDIPRKLFSIDRQIARRAGNGDETDITDEEIEALAQNEHDRWVAARRGTGTSHADLVPWEELPEDRREIDRVLVRAIPRLLAEVGLTTIRLTEPTLGPQRT